MIIRGEGGDVFRRHSMVSLLAEPIAIVKGQESEIYTLIVFPKNEAGVMVDHVKLCMSSRDCIIARKGEKR